MKILHVGSEFFPLIKTGGLADVMTALPFAQRQLDADARLLLPGFPAIDENISHRRKVANLTTFAGNITLYYGHYYQQPIYLIDAPGFYQRKGSPYHDDNYQAYADNLYRFALLGFIAAALAKGCDPSWKADLVHAHDWPAGLACSYLAADNCPVPAVFTIHNIAYQGLFPALSLDKIGLPNHFYQMEGLEFFGQLSFLKAGIFYATHCTTVSPTYAKEILSADFAYGLEGLLQKRHTEQRLSGILNGIDTQTWSPETDRFIHSPYSIATLKEKVHNKQSLQKELGLLQQKEQPLFAVVSRMTYQKGLDLILAILPLLMTSGAQFVLLGSGDPHLEEAFRQIAARYQQQIQIVIGYDEALAHRIIAGADVLMIPSRFEPCGLTQLYALQYGTLPLVRRTGGLADTVTDCSLEALAENQATGFVFNDNDPADLYQAVRRALLLWQTPNKWCQVQKTAMLQIVDWRPSAQRYLSLYQQLLQTIPCSN